MLWATRFRETFYISWHKVGWKKGEVRSAGKKSWVNPELRTFYLTIEQIALHYRHNGSQMSHVIYRRLLHHCMQHWSCEGYLGHSEQDPISPAGWVIVTPAGHCNVVAMRPWWIYWSAALPVFSFVLPSRTDPTYLSISPQQKCRWWSTHSHKHIVCLDMGMCSSDESNLKVWKNLISVVFYRCLKWRPTYKLNS